MPEDDKAMGPLAEQVHGDLATRLTAFEDGYMLTKYVTIAEVIDQNGERGLLSVTSHDLKTWETLGMLEWGKQSEQSSNLHLDEEDD